MELPFQNKESKNELTPLEQRQKAVETQQQQIDKEFEQKMFIEKYGRSLVLAAVAVVVFLLGIWGFTSNYQLISSFFDRDEPAPVVQTDGPPDGFEIIGESSAIIQNPDKRTYDVFVRLVNSDPEWGVSMLEYEIGLKGAGGNIVGSRKGSTYILPNSRKALAEINIPANAVPTSIDLKLEPQKVQRLRDFGTIELGLRGIRYFQQNNRGRAEGTLINNSPFAFNQIDVVVVLFNRDQEIVGLNKTVIGSVLSSQQRDFTVSWPEYLGSDTQVVVEPTVNVFESSNFLNTFGSTQELDF